MTDLVPSEQFASGEEPCAGCGRPLASDQRYCLNCGRRRGPERVPYASLLAGREPREVIEPPADEPPRHRPGLGLLAGAGAVSAAILIALGVLIGVLLEDDPVPAAAIKFPEQKAPVVNVTAGGGTAAAADEELTEDWPEGESGFTVQLQALPKDATQVAQVATAKSEASTKGAKDVGALDSDNYASLEGGSYVVYSGIYKGKGAKKKAQGAAKKLKKDFPGAKVIEVKSEDAALEAKGEKPEEKEKVVSDDKLKDLEKSTGEAQQDKSRKLPDTIKLEGKAPPKDKKKAGGGGDAEVIE